MSDAAAERLVVFLEAKVTEFEKRMAKAERTGTGSYTKLREGSRRATQNMEADMIRTTTRINQALASTSGKIGAFAKSFAAGFAGGVVASAFAGITTGLNDTVRGIAAVGDEAKRAGLALQDFQEWKFVAEQNRIGVDALTDGFKELSLRADEFISTGAGSAAESFNRLGFSSTDLAEKLKDPSELMLEIIGRLEGVDKAAQIRIADELFGGTGGERFVELLDQGEAGIRKTIAGAHEAGAVLDDQMIKKAQELDRRWNELTTTVGTGFKVMAVGVADTVQSLLGMSNALDGILEDEARARALLGNSIYERLKEGREVTEEQAELVSILADNMEAAAVRADQQAMVLRTVAGELAQGNPELAADLRRAANDMTALTSRLREGWIEAGEFRDELAKTVGEAEATVAELLTIDSVRFDGVGAGLQWLKGLLGEVTQAAIEASNSLPGGVTTGTPIQGGAAANMPPTFDSYMPTSPRPQEPGVDSYGDWEHARDNPPGGGGKKGGGKRGSDRAAGSLISSLMTPIEEIQLWHKEAMEALALADAEQLALIGGRHEAVERIEAEHQARLRELQANTNAQRLAEMGDFFGMAAGLAGLGGQRLVKVVAGAEAIQGTINAHGAYLKALNSPVPMTPWGRMAAAGNVLLAGLKGVSAIRSAGGVGGGGGSAVSGGGGSSSSGSSSESAGPLRATMDPLDPNALFTGAVVRTLLENLMEEAGNRGLIIGFSR